MVERVGVLASQFAIGETLSADLTHGELKASAVVPAFAVVETETLFIEVAEPRAGAFAQTDLSCESHAEHHVAETRLVAERIVGWIHLEGGETTGVLQAGFF